MSVKKQNDLLTRKQKLEAELSKVNQELNIIDNTLKEPFPKRVTVYLHGSKDDMYYKGDEIGLTGDALGNFCYACYEVAIDLMVDKDGNSKIVGVDGMNVISDEGDKK